MRRLQLLLLVVGIVLFVLVLRSVGVAAILAGLRRVGWTFLAIAAVEIAIDFLHSEGWRRCIPGHARTVSRLDTFLSRTAGFAVNVLTPTATVGGEVVKGLLIRRWVPIADGFASILIDKLTFAIGQAIFLVFGLAAIFRDVPLNDRERSLAVAVLALWIGGVGAFFFLQKAGIFTFGLRVMRALFGGSDLVERLPGRAGAFDAKIQTFLFEHRRDLAASVAFHVVGQAARTLQFYLVLSALGLEPTLASSLTTAAGLVFIEATLFIVPSRLGVFEQGHVLIFSALGYGAAAGLTVAFAMRLSELASAFLGLAALGYYHFRPEEAAVEEATPARASEGGKR